MKCKLPRGIVIQDLPILVTISGSGNSTYCNVNYKTSGYTGAAEFEAMAGDTITFKVYGRSTIYKGTVTIDGATVLTVTNQTTQSYAWTIPKGVTSISITLAYVSTSSQRRGTITVTTA